MESKCRRPILVSFDSCPLSSVSIIRVSFSMYLGKLPNPNLVESLSYFPNVKCIDVIHEDYGISINIYS